MILARLFSISALMAQAANYPANWWAPVPEEQRAWWEVLPQAAKPGEVSLSKRTLMGSHTNTTPRDLAMRAARLPESFGRIAAGRWR